MNKLLKLCDLDYEGGIIEDINRSVSFYFDEGVPPGSCFHAMLRNDLFRAAGSLHPSSKPYFVYTVLWIFAKYSSMDEAKFTDETRWMMDPDGKYSEYLEHVCMLHALKKSYNHEKPQWREAYLRMEKIVQSYINDGVCSEFLRTVLSGDLLMACLSSREHGVRSTELVELVQLISYSVPEIAIKNVDNWINDVDGARTTRNKCLTNTWDVV